MAHATLYVGDVNQRLADIDDHSIDFVCCSPPFLALRKYGDNEEDEMGSEATPALFIDALLAVTAEFRRILTPTGSIAIELGDTYAGSGGHGGDYNDDGLRAGQPKFDGSAAAARGIRGGRSTASADMAGRGANIGGHHLGGDGWPLAKSLVGIPAAYQLSLAYGYNVLDRYGPDSPAGRWRVRNMVVWARPNPPVGSLGDKVRPATSYITVACVSDRRWFDLDAVREPLKDSPGNRYTRKVSTRDASVEGATNNNVITKDYDPTASGGAPPLDWWEDEDPTGHATLILPTHPYPGAHYATWPPQLAKRLVEMMAPQRVCRTCGEPSRRLVESEYEAHGPKRDEKKSVRGKGVQDGEHAQAFANGRATKHTTTTGWTDCGHGDWRPGAVLDPFAGSGTTLAVATGCGRDAKGIELYDENVDLIRDRVGMFLNVDERPFSWPYWRYRFAKSHREYGDAITASMRRYTDPDPDDYPDGEAPGPLDRTHAAVLDRFRAGYVRNDRPGRPPQTEGKVAR